jgi:hypothetical protein
MEMAVRSMETAVMAMESMEMAPGALPRPRRVPEQRLLSPESRRWRRRSCGTSSGKIPIPLGFRLRKDLYRRRGGVRGQPWPTHQGVAHPRGHSRHHMVWLPLPPPLRLSFGLRLVSGKNRRFGLHFVPFREYFWYVSNISIIFYAPCLFMHHLHYVLLYFVAFLCDFRNKPIDKMPQCQLLVFLLFLCFRKVTQKLMRADNHPVGNSKRKVWWAQ